MTAASGSPGDVALLAPDRADAVADALADAFTDYPVMRFVLGPDPDYSDRLRRLVRFFVGARALRGEPLLGIGGEGELRAAAIVSYPGGPPSPPELAVLRESTWAALGEQARTRYEVCGAVWAGLDVDLPRIHLNMIGVRGADRGEGLGRLVLDRVHELARETRGATGVSLTTEDASNVELYRHLGYEVTGHARINPELETWAMFRRNE